MGIPAFRGGGGFDQLTWLPTTNIAIIFRMMVPFEFLIVKVDRSTDCLLFLSVDDFLLLIKPRESLNFDETTNIHDVARLPHFFCSNFFSFYRTCVHIKCRHFNLIWCVFFFGKNLQNHISAKTRSGRLRKICIDGLHIKCHKMCENNKPEKRNKHNIESWSIFYKPMKKNIKKVSFKRDRERERVKYAQKLCLLIIFCSVFFVVFEALRLAKRCIQLKMMRKKRVIKANIWCAVEEVEKMQCNMSNTEEKRKIIKC